MKAIEWLEVDGQEYVIVTNPWYDWMPMWLANVLRMTHTHMSPAWDEEDTIFS